MTSIYLFMPHFLFSLSGIIPSKSRSAATTPLEWRTPGGEFSITDQADSGGVVLQIMCILLEYCKLQAPLLCQCPVPLHNSSSRTISNKQEWVNACLEVRHSSVNASRCACTASESAQRHKVHCLFVTVHQRYELWRAAAERNSRKSTQNTAEYQTF